jgi:choline monooxygenase
MRVQGWQCALHTATIRTASFDEQALQTMRYTVDPDITVAHSIDSAFYRDEAAYAQACERIFARSWQWIGDTSDVMQPGELSPRDMLPGCMDEPLLLARDTDGTLRCLSNVCTQRGDLLVERPCQAQQICCRRHARCFDLSGRLRAAPGFEGVENFPAAGDDLADVPLGLLGPHAFAAIAPVAPLEAFLGDLRARLDWLPWDRLRHDAARSRDYHVAAHWALYVDNSLEGLHAPRVHPVLERSGSRTELYRYATLQLVLAGEGEPAFDPPPGTPDHGLRVAAYCWWVFPNMMFNIYPWGLSLNLVLPLAASRTRVAFRCYVWDEDTPDEDAGGALEHAEMRDEAIVESVQRGVRSHWYRSGRYAPAREQGLHHFHRLLCEFMNE